MRTYVREEWPSPQQFNHAIIAIPVARGTRLPAVLEDESGAMLFFDPTDSFTPLGELPLSLPGSFGLVVSPSDGRLLRMPVTAPEAHARVRTIAATIAADGGFTATIRTTTTGDPASRERYFFKAATKDSSIRAGSKPRFAARCPVPGSTLGTVGDDRESNRFELTLGLESRAFGQGLGGDLLIGGAIAGRFVSGAAGRHAVNRRGAEPADERDRFELTIPTGLMVDELPPSRTMDTPFGRFDVKWAVDGSRIVRTLTLRVLNGSVPASDYALVRRFIDTFRDAESLPVVLVRRR